MFGAFEKFKNYIPLPFWGVDQEYWYHHVNALPGDDRDVLSYYPFRWAFAPPHDAVTSVEFLRGIGVDDERVSADAVEAQCETLPTFAELQARGSVEWGDGAFDENPPPGFRMIPEWEPMAGALFHWPVFYPPLWETFQL